MKANERVRVELHSLLTSVPEKGEHQSHVPIAKLLYVLNMRLEVPSASLDALEKRMVYFPAGNRTTLPTCPGRSLVTTPTEICWLNKLFVNTTNWDDVIFEVTEFQ